MIPKYIEDHTFYLKHGMSKEVAKMIEEEHRNFLNRKEIKEKSIKLIDLIEKYGYWSKEVEDFNSKIDYEQMVKINNKARELVKNKYK